MSSLDESRGEAPRRVSRSGREQRLSPLLLVLALALAFGLPACGGGSGDGAAADSTAADSTEAAESAGEKTEKSNSVTTADVIRGDLVLPIVAEGSIRARHQAQLRFELGGKLAEILVEEGQRVKQGQLLARIDSRDYKLAFDEARAKYLQALSQIAVEDALAGWSDSGTNGDMPAEMDPAALLKGDYRSEIIAARTGLSTAAAAESRARLNLERCEVRAPFAGVVSGLTLTAGEWVSGTQNLALLTDDRNLEAVLDVLESDLVALVQGRPALLAIPALQETLQVTVDIVSPSLETDSRSCRVLMRLTSEDGRVKPGMFVRGAIAGEILYDRMLVPREAILLRDGRPLVFKVADGLSQWLYVTTGERNDRFVEIERVLQGGTLEPGDPVVISDHLTLTHGAQVKIKKRIVPKIPWKLNQGDG